MKKVVVTGIGAVTALGNTVPEYWENLIAGKSGIGIIDRIPTDNLDTKVAAQVDDSFEAEASKHFKKRTLSATTKLTRMGLASACEAVEDCGIDFDSADKSRIASIFGVADNSYEDAEHESKQHLTIKRMPSIIPAMLAIKYGFTGPTFNVSTACASAAYATALGKQMIASGMYDMVITGGISSLVTNIIMNGFNQLLAMSVNPDPETACRPFTKNRDGFIMGEGAASIIIESEEHAKARGAKIYCELAGVGLCCEAYNLTAPKTNGQGMAEAMRLALNDASMSPDEVDYINAHGTSTNLNDLYETLAIKEIFGQKAYDIPVSSIKAAVGHTLSAGGAVEGVACIKAIETGMIPPTIHYDEPDPDLDLNYVPNKAINKNPNVVLSNSFGFGGHNAALIFKKYQ